MRHLLGQMDSLGLGGGCGGFAIGGSGLVLPTALAASTSIITRLVTI